MRLTTATIEGLKLDTGVVDKIVFDDDVPGFGIRVRASGVRTWIFQYKIGGRTRRLVLGKVSAIKLAKARDIAGELHAKVRLGGDPASEKREKVQRALDTFGWLVDLFLGQYRARASTKDAVRRHLRKYAAPLHPTPVAAVTLRDVADLLAKIDKASGPTTANRVRATLSTCFSWAMREGLALSNPVANTNKREERSRDRILSDDELRRIWNAAGHGTYGTIVKLLILTGQRRSEIADLSWPEVDFERHTLNLPAERTKNKRPHVVPLAPTARALLEGRPRADDAVFEFTAWAYSKDLLNKRSGVSDWVIHDIRRSVATGMADIGIQPHIIEAVLNHVSGHKGGVAGIYNCSSYAARRRRRWRGGMSVSRRLLERRPWPSIPAPLA
jgi:integrase